MAQDSYDDPGGDLAQIAYLNGRADALLEAEHARQTAADAAGDRIVAAANSTLMRGLWGEDAGWQESGSLFDDQGHDDEAGDEGDGW